jgi:DNA invertase Pin-like site-specific DNA recombinase
MKFVAYYRVSTKRQGNSGLGLEAQQHAVMRHVDSSNGKLVKSFQEVESGRKDDRPQLKAALETAKKNKATVIIAKLDRLGRRASYILRLIDESGVDFHICDMPNADKLTITILAAVAERESEAISKRTSDAIQAKKRRGEPVGSNDWKSVQAKGIEVIKADKMRRASYAMKVIAELREAHVTTLLEMANCLNRRGIPTARNGKWTATAVKRVIAAV